MYPGQYMGILSDGTPKPTEETTDTGEYARFVPILIPQVSKEKAKCVDGINAFPSLLQSSPPTPNKPSPPTNPHAVPLAAAATVATVAATAAAVLPPPSYESLLPQGV